MARVYLIVVNGEIKKSVALKQMVGLKARSIFIKMGESKGGLVLEVLACGIFFTIQYSQGLK